MLIILCEKHPELQEPHSEMIVPGRVRVAKVEELNVVLGLHVSLNIDTAGVFQILATACEERGLVGDWSASIFDVLIRVAKAVERAVQDIRRFEDLVVFSCRFPPGGGPLSSVGFG